METEREKILQGESYNAPCDELIKERNYAKELLYECNMLRPSETQKRTGIIDQLFDSVKNKFLIEQPFRCDYRYNIHIGENFYANMGCTILDEAAVTFGNNVLLAPNGSIYTAGHPIDVGLRNAGQEYALPVTIGNNVWIEGDVVIVHGVTIGDNSIIGAGSVVTKSIPANVIAVGNPCRVIKAVSGETDK